MKKTLLILICSLFMLNFVSAYVADVAYVVTSNSNVNPEFINALTELGLNHTKILSANANTTNFSQYKMILLNNEDFTNPQDIPVNDYPALMVNGKNMENWGWVKTITKSKQSSPFYVDILNLAHPIADGFIQADAQVYTSEDANIYYLDEYNIYSGIKTIAATKNNPKDVIVGYAEAGTNLTKPGKPNTIINADSVFIGMAETNYWTNATRQLFKNSILWLTREPPLSTFQIDLSTGWNLVSFPLSLSQDEINRILTDYEIKEYNNGFVDATTIGKNKGYFISSENGDDLIIEGNDIIGTQSINLISGMNLVGVSGPADVGFNSLPNNVIEVSKRVGSNYEIATKYETGWYNEFPLKPGEGYWFKTNQGGVWQYPIV